MKLKKGSMNMAFNIGNLIPRLLFLIFVTLSIVMVIRHFVILNIDVNEAEAMILMNRIIYSPCVSYYSSNIERGFPGIIDYAKFNSNTLDNCVFYGEDNDFAAANLTLIDIDGNDMGSIYYNKKGYEIWLPRTDMDGPGGARSYFDTRYVIVDRGGNRVAAVLLMEVLIPNY